jgi:hypothetical protein
MGRPIIFFPVRFPAAAPAEDEVVGRAFDNFCH